MDTHKKIREHISALSDGELSPSDLELAFAALYAADGQHAWNTYFRIGDALRARATPELSGGFGAKLAARLDAEPLPVRRSAGAGGASPPAGAPSTAPAVEAAPGTPGKSITASAS